jgi:hypothetical protein
MEWAWWVAAISALVAVVVAVVVIVFKRESRRVAVKLRKHSEDDAAEELLDDMRARAVVRIQKMNQLRKSPSALKMALKQYLQEHRAYRKVVEDSRSEVGDGLRSLYKPPEDVLAAHTPTPLVQAARGREGGIGGAIGADGADEATPFGLHHRQSSNAGEAALLKLREVAFRVLKQNFDFLSAEQLAAMCFDASEVHIQRGDVLVSEGSRVATPSLYIVQSGLLECTCDDGGCVPSSLPPPPSSWFFFFFRSLRFATAAAAARARVAVSFQHGVLI